MNYDCFLLAGFKSQGKEVFSFSQSHAPLSRRAPVSDKRDERYSLPGVRIS